MTPQKTRKPLGGPWLKIARRIRTGHANFELLKLAAESARESTQVRGNIDTMLRLGFIGQRPDGMLYLTPLGEELTT